MRVLLMTSGLCPRHRAPTGQAFAPRVGPPTDPRPGQPYVLCQPTDSLTKTEPSTVFTSTCSAAASILICHVRLQSSYLCLPASVDSTSCAPGKQDACVTYVHMLVRLVTATPARSRGHRHSAWTKASYYCSNNGIKHTNRSTSSPVFVNWCSSIGGTNTV
jgi:hypothetical protein